MGKLIQVPYIKQPKNSPKCGAACAAMVIKYYTGANIGVEDIWPHISATSPELKREYCRTYKIGAYIANNHFRCSSIQYTSLKELLAFCNATGVAPIINHKSFENKQFGHFSVVKNISGNQAIINDPENKNRSVVSLSELELMATKTSVADEVGGNMAIIPAMDKFSYQSRACPHCGKDIDMSFSYAANATVRIVNQDLCQSCDAFSLTP
ncbi:MAG TPA: hypothetical protein DGR15_11520 [Methylophilus sp.]|nr:hypothetical protein [Methylophilus sp.]